MDSARQNSAPMAKSILGEIVEAIRSEPALAWFAAQGLWIAQPALEAFWPPETITAIAELLESRKVPVRTGEEGTQIP
jgi:hypothetical protein